MKLLLLLLALGLSTAMPTRAADFDLVGREMSRMLQNGHYARLPFNAKLGARIFDDFLDSLDPERVFFTAKDVSGFSRSYRRSLHLALLEGRAMGIANEIYGVYQERVRDRMVLAQALLKENHFTFESDQEVILDRSKLRWPGSEADATAQWELEVEDRLLTELLRRERSRQRASEQGKEDPYQGKPTAIEKLAGKYRRDLQEVESADEEDIANHLFSAVALAHDPHTEYFSARESEQFHNRMTNQLVGIGVNLVEEQDGSLRITGIYVGGPADRAGELELEDRVIAVSPNNDGNWVDTLFMPIDKTIQLIKGKARTRVGLRLGGTNPREISIKRGIVRINDDLARSEIFVYPNDNGERKLGYLDIPSFYYDRRDRSRNVSVHVEKILKRMKKEKVEGLVIDLRNNGGGSLQEVARMVGLFVGRGPVVQVKHFSGQIESLGGNNYRKPVYKGSVVLLTNKNSASASEIFAAALQDYRRAVIVGASSTYGKGTVQSPEDISRYMPLLADRERAGELKYTIQKYYRASGESVQLKGVVPDIVLPDITDGQEVGEKFEKHALAYDIIRKAPGFYLRKNRKLHLPTLQLQSAERVDKSPDFKFLTDEVNRLKERIARNKRSLNREKRRALVNQREERRKERHADLRRRFKKTTAKDAEEFHVLRLSTDDLKSSKLSRIDREAEKNRYVRRSKDNLRDLDRAPEWPNELDYVEREGFAVLKDLISLNETGQPVHLATKKVKENTPGIPSEEE